MLLVYNDRRARRRFQKVKPDRLVVSRKAGIGTGAAPEDSWVGR